MKLRTPSGDAIGSAIICIMFGVIALAILSLIVTIIVDGFADNPLLTTAILGGIVLLVIVGYVVALKFDDEETSKGVG